MSANKHFDHFNPKYGFGCGAMHVTRVAHVEGRGQVLAVDTPHHHVQIAVSPMGRSVRVWIDGDEVAARGRVDSP